jgi:hypothetical protein
LGVLDPLFDMADSHVERSYCLISLRAGLAMRGNL